MSPRAVDRAGDGVLVCDLRGVRFVFADVFFFVVDVLDADLATAVFVAFAVVLTGVVFVFLDCVRRGVDFFADPFLVVLFSFGCESTALSLFT